MPRAQRLQLARAEIRRRIARLSVMRHEAEKGCGCLVAVDRVQRRGMEVFTLDDRYALADVQRDERECVAQLALSVAVDPAGVPQVKTRRCAPVKVTVPAAKVLDPRGLILAPQVADELSRQ